MRCNLQYESEYGDTYAPTAKLWTIRTLVALAAQEGMQLKKFDLSSAFLVARADVVVLATRFVFFELG
jgi:hypothetical protein